MTPFPLIFSSLITSFITFLCLGRSVADLTMVEANEEETKMSDVFNSQNDDALRHYSPPPPDFPLDAFDDDFADVITDSPEFNRQSTSTRPTAPLVASVKRCARSVFPTPSVNTTAESVRELPIKSPETRFSQSRVSKMF